MQTKLIDRVRRPNDLDCVRSNDHWSLCRYLAAVETKNFFLVWIMSDVHSSEAQRANVFLLWKAGKKNARDSRASESHTWWASHVRADHQTMGRSFQRWEDQRVRWATQWAAAIFLETTLDQRSGVATRRRCSIDSSRAGRPNRQSQHYSLPRHKGWLGACSTLRPLDPSPTHPSHERCPRQHLWGQFAACRRRRRLGAFLGTDRDRRWDLGALLRSTNEAGVYGE